MIHQRSQLLSSCFLFTDLVLTTAAWFLAYYLYFESGWFHLEKGVPGIFLCLQRVPLLWLLSVVAYRLASMYDVGRLRRFREEMVAVFKGSLLLALLVMARIFFLHDAYESRAGILLFWLLSVALVLIGRRAAWGIIHTLRSRGYNQTFSIIVGTGRAARKTARALQRVSWLGIKNIGFVDEKTNRLSGDLDVMGGFADLPHLIEKYGVRHVFVALPLNRTDDARRIGKLRRDDLGSQFQPRQEAVRVLRHAAADDDQVRAEQRLHVGEVLLHPLGPLLPAQLLLVTHPGGGASLGVLTADLQVPELGVRHQ